MTLHHRWLRLSVVSVLALLTIPRALSVVRAGEPVPDALIGRIDQVEFNGERLADALERLAKEQKITLDLRWTDLAEINITPDTRVQLKLRNVSVGRALNALLNSADARVQVLDNGHVLVTSKAQLYLRYTTERRYDISFLLADATTDTALREQTESVVQTICDTISRESWDGESVRIEPDAGGLVIAQTEQNHRAIAATIDRMHEQRATRPMNAEEVRAAAAAQAHPWLDKKIGDLAFRGKQLGDVIESLGNAVDRPIVVNWKALEAIRVVKTLPVTTDLSNLTLRHALDKLIIDVGGSQARLNYAVAGGRVVISSGDDLSMNVATRVYDIRQGLINPDTRVSDLAAILSRVCGIDPLSWRDAGGRVGQVRELEGQLIVTQTPDVHRRIADELKDILPH